MKNALHYTDVGTGDIVLVFLHYFSGSANSWAKVIAVLSNQFRCIAIDLPGFGNSQGEVKTLSVNECAKEAAQVIKVLGLKRYVLIGHSMGGKIALSLASFQPFGLISLVLVAPSPPTSEPMTVGERTQMLNAYGNRTALETQLNNVTANPLSTFDLENAIADNWRTSLASWNWWIEEGSSEDISPAMTTVRVPVFVIGGAKDKKFSGSFLQKEFLKYFPSAAFREIEDAGHLIPIECALELAMTILEFARPPKGS